ncbi:right-handed parallel beta-helix repeat-containing protein [Sorangium sp. So ce381]|uniref:right-handed parallel beta-helix repeat-containing protein n=1 Tax=Sorangium sp. So ce381 TaxID=3133307 RepID=UPI003F5CB05F
MLAFPFSTRFFHRSWRAFVLLALFFAMAGCGADDTPPGAGPPDAGPAACPPGTMPVDGGCQEAGLPPGVTAGLPPDMPCSPGEAPIEGGGCQPAGVPPDACGEGFEPDGRGGCNAILPEGTCPRGQMAIPGETRCHEVAPCGDGDYGTIPVEATTQFVNGAYAGSDSDGSRAKPWKHIQDGVRRAEPGAIVAVAAGRYAEDVLIQGKPIRLWGRCPTLVEVVGTGAAIATLQILRRSANESQVHGLAITGPRIGLLTSGSSEVFVEHVWIHDSGNRGIGVENSLGPTSITLSASLVASAEEIGVYVGGADATIESIVVRGTRSRIDGTSGRGIAVEDDPSTKQRARVAIHTSLVEQNHEIGVFIGGSDATIDATVVRDTQPNSNGENGAGIVVRDNPITHERGKTKIHTSLLEQNHDVGVLNLGSDTTIEATVVRNTQPSTDGYFGNGVQIDEHAKLTLLTSLLEQNHHAGVLVIGSDAAIESTVVRYTQPSGIGEGGHGITVYSNPITQERANVTLHTSLVEENRELGVFVGGSDATIESTVVRHTQPINDGTFGRGIEIQDDTSTNERSNVTIRTSLLERNHDAGVFISGSDATFEATVVRDTQPLGDGSSGLGIEIRLDPDTNERANVTLRSSIVEQNHDVGVLVSGSDATIETTVIRAIQRGTGGTGGRGISIQHVPGTQERANVTLRSSIVEQNHDVGVFVGGSDATIEGTVVRNTESNVDGTFGDGIAVLSSGTPTTATIISTRIESNARAGISTFSAAVVLVSSAVRCNIFNLSVAKLNDLPFTFDGSKANLCGCEGPALTCAVCEDLASHCPHWSAGLSPPEPISPAEPLE